MLDKKTRVQLKKASSQTTLKYLDLVPIQLQRIAWTALCLNSKETDAQNSFSTKTSVPPNPKIRPNNPKYSHYSASAQHQSHRIRPYKLQDCPTHIRLVKYHVHRTNETGHSKNKVLSISHH